MVSHFTGVTDSEAIARLSLTQMKNTFLTIKMRYQCSQQN